MFAIIENKKIIKYPVDPRLDNPNVSFTDNWEGGVINRVEYVKVFEVTPPDYDIYKNIEELTPVFIEGKWTQVWQQTNVSPEEVSKRFLSKRQRMSVSKFQLKFALYEEGLLQDVETLIEYESNIPVKLAWQDTTSFNRLSDVVKFIGEKLNLNDARLDEIFEKASLAKT